MTAVVVTQCFYPEFSASFVRYAETTELRTKLSTQHSAFSTSHPSATSSIIISVKPRAKKMVPILECSPSDISGISSSTTT